MLRRAIVWRWRVLCLSLLMVLVVGVAGYAGSEEKADDGWSVVKQAYAGISEDQLETALAADSLELRATQINFHINPEDIIMEVARYNQAIAFYGGEPITSFLLEKLTQSMGEEAFYDVFDVISISPDGHKILLRFYGENSPFLGIWDENEASLQLVAPALGLNHDYVMLMTTTLFDCEGLEERALIWSPTGDYFVLAHPEKIVTSNILKKQHYNMILVDVTKGVASPIVKQPNDEELSSNNELLPHRAGFDAWNKLFYECIGDAENGKMVNFLFVYDLATGETWEIGRTDNIKGFSNDSMMWVTPLGLVNTFFESQTGGGLRLTSLTGDTQFLHFPFNDDDSRIRGWRLLDAKGDRAVLLSDNPAWMSMFTWLSTEDVYNGYPLKRVMLYPDAMSGTHAQVNPVAGWSSLVNEESMERRDDALRIPYNASLSPDGRYLLLTAMSTSRAEPSLYIMDLDTGVCGEVNYSGLSQHTYADFAPFANTKDNNYAGLRWVDNNRILIYIGDGYRVFELRLPD